MAKKSSRGKSRGRSSKGRKEAAPEHELPGGFWRQVGAVLLILIAVVFVMTWFGEGGSALNMAHEMGMKALGYGVYAIPVLLVYLAVKIFRSNDNRISPVLWFTSALLVCWVSGLSGIPTIGSATPTGGIVGEFLNKYVTQILNPAVAAIIYFVVIFLTLIFILQKSPKAVVKSIGDTFKTTKKKEDDNNMRVAINTIGKERGDMDIKVNPGVAVVETMSAIKKKMPVLGSKDAKTKIVAPVAEEPKALIAVNDADWKMPGVDLLEKKQSPADPGNIQQNVLDIKRTLADFGIEVEMEGANIGPRVTQYTMRPPQGVNLSKITARDKELALNLAVDKIRIEAPIPGTRSVGVEIPNTKSADVRLRGIIESDEWKKAKDPLSFAVGKDISGKAVVASLAKMPHLLVAGTTGSGKSVMTNTLITSLLYRYAPSDLKFIIVDPKQVEMAQYEDVPHLLTPIITTVEKAMSAMKWAVNEMERRYTLMAEKKVKNIADYNAKMEKETVTVNDKDGNPQEHDGGKMPYIVIIVDEMADLMMTAGKDLEFLIVRVAQKGRAAGMHLVLATQRPEAKVITGLIKTNIPGRIAFAVGSQLDSRIMIDQGGAEKLLGKGDMLMLTTEMMGKPRRIQGAWASDEDIAKVTDFLRLQRAPEYNPDVVAQPVQIKGMAPADGGGDMGGFGRKYNPSDPVVRRAVQICLDNGKFSTSLLQGYLSKAHGYVFGLGVWLGEIGVIGPANGNKPREVLISSMEEFDQLAGL